MLLIFKDMNRRQKRTDTLKYSLASCLCSSKICFDNSLLASGWAGLKCGSSIKCTEAKSSSSTLLFACVSCLLLASKFSLVILGEFLKVVELIELSILPVTLRGLLVDAVIAFDLDSGDDSLSLFWLLAVNTKEKPHYLIFTSKFGVFFSIKVVEKIRTINNPTISQMVLIWNHRSNRPVTHSPA